MSQKAYLAELIGTFALVFIGAGAVTVNAVTGGALGLLGVALAHGLVLMSMIYAVGHISGTHVNPAVTLAMLATGKMQLEKAAGYIVAQLAGAALAGGLLVAIFSSPQAAASHYGLTDLAQGFSFVNGIVLEAVLTFLLVFTIFGVAVSGKAHPASAGMAIGLVLAFDILVGGPFTGAAMNPARAFGPALASNFWGTQLVYWVGPIIGALVAGFAYKLLFLENEDDTKKKR